MQKKIILSLKEKIEGIGNLLIASCSFVETIFYMAISPEPVVVDFPLGKKQKDLLNSNRKLVNLMQYR